tara:strand:+ start:339 stop:719 length:381 start_codon:yes stop_codon:yes gene_type:complete
MWQDIIKIRLQPLNKKTRSKYVRRLILRFLEYIPNDQPFSARTVINFYNSPEQEQYKNENDWEPSVVLIVTGLIKHRNIQKKRIRVGMNNVNLYGQYDMPNLSSNLQSLFVVGEWPEKVRLHGDYE